MFEAYSHYTNYYGDGNLAAWRALSAKDKAANIIHMYSVIGHNLLPTVADIGCGDGAVIRELDRQGFGESYIGFEISISGITAASQHKYSRRLTDLVIFDGAHLPVRDKAFDLAVLSHVLEHVECPRQLLREAARIAKYVFVEVPLELHARTPHNFHWSDVGHINLFNMTILRYLVQSIGLRILAERVTCPRRAIFTFQHPGLAGNLRWGMKSLLLKLSRSIACHIMTYHGCLLAKQTDAKDVGYTSGVERDTTMPPMPWEVSGDNIDAPEFHLISCQMHSGSTSIVDGYLVSSATVGV